MALIASCAVACLLGFPLARLSARVRWVAVGVFLLRPMLLAWYLLVSLAMLMDAIGFGVLSIEGAWARDLLAMLLLLLVLDLLWGLSLATPTLIYRHRRLQNRHESGPGAAHR